MIDSSSRQCDRPLMKCFLDVKRHPLLFLMETKVSNFISPARRTVSPLLRTKHSKTTTTSIALLVDHLPLTIAMTQSFSSTQSLSSRLSLP